MSSATATIEQVRQAQLHRETYIAVVSGHLSRRGSKQDFARRLGITPQYLSNLLDPYDHRTPSLDLARRMAATLPLSPIERHDLVEHIQSTKLRPMRIVQVMTRWDGREPGILDLHRQIEETRRVAKFAADPREAAALDRWVWRHGTGYLNRVDPWRRPVAWAGIALLLVEIAHNTHRHIRGLHFAKWANAVLAMAERSPDDEHAEFYDHHVTNGLRVEAVALTHLQLPADAGAILERATRTLDAKSRPGFWLPHLNRDLLNALAELPRTSVREARDVCARGVDACASYPSHIQPLLALLLERSLTGFYLRRKRLNQAEGLLEHWVDRIDDLPTAGPLHRVLLLNDYADLLWQRGERDAWRTVVLRAITEGAEARLTHQLSLIRRKYAHEWPELVEGLDGRTVLV